MKMPVVLLTSVLVACGGGEGTGPAEGQGMGKIEGRVVYRERIMLPPGAELEVQLEDVSAADAMATVMATVIIPLEGGPPYPFAIDYDRARIDPRMRYGLRATIAREGRQLFTNTDYVDPFAPGELEVLVRSIPGADRPATAALAVTLEDTRWELTSLDGEPAPAGANGKPVDLLLQSADRVAGGFSGCNRYRGGYSRQGNPDHGSPLSFGPSAGTLMACPEGMELEQAYLRALGSVNAFHLRGDTLVLLRNAEEVATFKAAAANPDSE